MPPEQSRPTKRARIERSSSPQAEASHSRLDVIRAKHVQDTRQDFKAASESMIKAHLEESKRSGAELFQRISVERSKNRAQTAASSQHDISPPPDTTHPINPKSHVDLKSYQADVRTSTRQLQDRHQEQIATTSAEYQKFRQKVQEKQPFELADQLKIYKERYPQKSYDTYLEYDEHNNLNVVTYTTGDDGLKLYESTFCPAKGTFEFSNMERESDVQYGPKESDALHASDILCCHIKLGLDKVKEYEASTGGSFSAENFRLKEITFSSVINDKMNEAARPFIPLTGKEFTVRDLSKDELTLGGAEAEKESHAYQSLSLSPFGKSVAWALKDGRDLLKSERNYAITVGSGRSDASPHPTGDGHAAGFPEIPHPAQMQTADRIDYQAAQVWRYDKETGDHTRSPGLAFITFHLE